MADQVRAQTIGGVAVTARGSDKTGGLDARAFDDTLINSIAQCDPNAWRATEIAHRGKSCHEGFFGIGHPTHGVIRRVEGKTFHRRISGHAR